MDSKSVLISVRPQWCEKICHQIGIENGKPIFEKSLEVRKTRPKLKPPFKCYIYETKGNTDTPWMDEDGHLDFHGRGQVICEFVCDEIRLIEFEYGGIKEDLERELNGSGLTNDEARSYFLSKGNRRNDLFLYGWHISDLQIYDKPRELSEFSRFGFYGMGNSKIVCGNCSCNHFVKSYDYDEPPECNINGCSLTRPTQSWCYVEEVK